jgi:hypothetical protein
LIGERWAAPDSEPDQHICSTWPARAAATHAGEDALPGRSATGTASQRFDGRLIRLESPGTSDDRVRLNREGGDFVSEGQQVVVVAGIWHGNIAWASARLGLPPATRHERSLRLHAHRRRKDAGCLIGLSSGDVAEGRTNRWSPARRLVGSSADPANYDSIVVDGHFRFQNLHSSWPFDRRPPAVAAPCGRIELAAIGVWSDAASTAIAEKV